MTRITEILRTALRADLSYSIMFRTARRTELSLILIRTIRTYIEELFRSAVRTEL